MTIFVSSDLRKAVPYQRILRTIFTGDADLLVEINESIRNFISKEDLALSQYNDQPEEKRPRLNEHLINQFGNSVVNNKNNDSTNAQTQSISTLQSATSTLSAITTQSLTTTQSISTTQCTTTMQSTLSTPTTLITQISNTNPLMLPSNIKQEKDINFGTPFCANSEYVSSNQNSANNHPFVEAGHSSSSETPTFPSNSYLLQSPFGTVSSSELKDLPPQILEKINFFSQDNQSISRSKSSDLLDDRGGNICNFLLSKETAQGNL